MNRRECDDFLINSNPGQLRISEKVARAKHFVQYTSFAQQDKKKLPQRIESGRAVDSDKLNEEKSTSDIGSDSGVNQETGLPSGDQSWMLEHLGGHIG